MTPKDSGREGRIFPRFSVREDVSRELESHVAMRTEELIEGGLSPEAAGIEAARLLGNRRSIVRHCVQIVLSHHRAVRRARIVGAMMQDLRYGLRSVVRTPGFALVAMHA